MTLKEMKLKARIENYGVIKKRLDKLAKFIKSDEKTDYFFKNESNINLSEIRLSRTSKNNIVKIKIPISSEVVQKSEEYDFKVDDENDFSSFLEKIGFKLKLILRKKWEEYRHRGVIIKLCNIKELGNYIELSIHYKDNIIKEDINKLLDILDELEIDKNNIDSRYYDKIKED